MNYVVYLHVYKVYLEANQENRPNLSNVSSSDLLCIADGEVYTPATPANITSDSLFHPVVNLLEWQVNKTHDGILLC